MLILLSLIGSLLVFFLLYGVIPTVWIRMSGRGIVKETDQNGMMLTFDDGPNPVYTSQLLDLLKTYNIQATFFVVGSKVQQYPDLIKRMHEEGHVIGIHHYQHISNWILTPAQLRKQLAMTERAIHELTNESVHYYRPPWGHFNLFTLFLSKKYKTVTWSHLFGDWKVENCQKNLLENLRRTPTERAILLLHDCGKTWGADEEAPYYMLQCLEIYLDEAIKKGTTFMTVNEL